MRASPVSAQSRGIVVLGVFRSGTSVTCAMLEQLGVWFGPHATMLGPEPANPLGYFQHAWMRDVNDSLLRSSGCDETHPVSPPELLERGDCALLRDVDLGWRDGRTWGLKDPRLCSTLAAFVHAGQIDTASMRIVHVVRDLDACLASAMRFHVLHKLAGGSEATMREMLAIHDRNAHWHVRELGVPTLELRYEQLLAAPEAAAAQLAEFAGNPDPVAVRRAAGRVGVTRALRRFRVRQALKRVTPLLLAVRGVRRIGKYLQRSTA